MLLTFIKEEINRSQERRIPFSHYMALNLYHPKWGYYNRFNEKIGKGGDFYTSSSVGPIFSEIWANHFVNCWSELNQTTHTPYVILEVGGGTGLFAHGILDVLAAEHPSIYKDVHYLMLEQSAYHLNQQKELLKDHVAKVEWLTSLTEVEQKPSALRPTIVFSNELFDALPVERIKNEQGKLYECWIEVVDDQIQEIWIPVKQASIVNYLNKMGIHLPDGHQLEIPVQAQELYKQMVQVVERGDLYTVDYGWRNDELLQPHRRNGTLIGYYKHNHVEDFYRMPGEIDLTAHAHFDALMKWGNEMGVETHSYESQREWLIQHGIMDFLQSHQDLDPFSPIVKKNRAIIQLISPGGMGDTFKVLSQRKV